MPCEDCQREFDAMEKEIANRDERIEALEKALDNVQGEINAAKDDLDDASKIIGRMI